MPCIYQQGVEAGEVGLGEDLGVGIPVLPLEYIGNKYVYMNCLQLFFPQNNNTLLI